MHHFHTKRRVKAGFKIFGCVLLALSLVAGWALYYRAAQIYDSLIAAYKKQIDAFQTDVARLSQRASKAELNNRRLIWARIDPGETKMPSPSIQIVALRDYVYRKNIVGPNDFDYRDPIANFINLDADKVRVSCGGMASNYHWLLSQFGFRSRTVQLATRDFVDGRKQVDTHVSVEVLDPEYNKWYVSDPTFNVSFSCSQTGELISFEGMLDCREHGGNIVPVENGTLYITHRTIQEYYLPIEKLLYAIRAIEIRDETGNVIKQALELPYPQWLENSKKIYQVKS